MSKYIIVKYAAELFGVAPKSYAAHPNSYTAQQTGVTAASYPTQEAAKEDLEKMREFNPTVGYGIVKVFEEDENDPLLHQGKHTGRL